MKSSTKPEKTTSKNQARQVMEPGLSLREKTSTAQGKATEAVQKVELQ